MEKLQTTFSALERGRSNTMEQIVADTNSIAAAILKDGISRRIILLPVVNFFAPDFMQVELEEHKKEFIAKSKLTEEQYENAVQAVLANITQMPAVSYLPFKKEAIETSPDHDDWPFFAVALCLKCPLWSNEKRLARQKKVEIISTARLLKRFGME